MTLDQLISEGEVVRQECSQDNMVGKIVVGEKYEVWISKCILYLEENEVSVSLKERFKDASNGAAGNSEKHLDTMMGVLKALKAFE